MIGESPEYNMFDYVSEYANTSSFIVPSAEVVKAGGIVLSCQRYCEEGYQAKQLLEKSGFTCEAIGSHYKVSMPPRFARTRVKDPDFGVPFLTGSAIAEANVDKSDFISTSRTPGLDGILLEEGTAVVTRSGTIGNVRFITKDIAGCAGTDDLIRISARNPDYSTEYYYVFSLSSLGNALITKDTYGGVIDHIEPDHLSEIAIPALPKKLRIRITNLMKEANTLRINANALLEKVEIELQKTCKLTALVKLKVDNLVENDGGATTYSCSLSKALKLGDDFNTLRLDSTFYNPLALKAREEIGNNEQWTTVEEGSEAVILLGKTFVPGVHKVEKEFGMPYFTGKELFKFRQSPETYITCQKKQILEKLTVKAGTVLITCAGTVGKVMYVRGALENTAITHDAIRVISSANKLHSGFLYAFLVSEYGKIQLDQCSYGSVIPRLYSDHIKNIMLPEPQDMGNSIGEKVDQAFDCRTEAFKKENQAIDLFMSAIRDGKDAVESKWGRDY